MRRNAPCPRPPRQAVGRGPMDTDALPADGEDWADAEGGAPAAPTVPAALCGASIATRHFLAVFDASGHLLARTPSPHGAPVRAIEAAFGVPEGEGACCPSVPGGRPSPLPPCIPRIPLSPPDPVLFTTGEDGSLAVHNLTVWVDGSRVAGRSDWAPMQPSKHEASGAPPKGQGACARWGHGGGGWEQAPALPPPRLTQPCPQRPSGDLGRRPGGRASPCSFAWTGHLVRAAGRGRRKPTQ